MPKYLVETISQFRISYIIEAKEESHALDTVVSEDCEELTQEHLGEVIFSSREVNDDEIVRIFRKDNENVPIAPEIVLDLVKVVDYND